MLQTTCIGHLGSNAEVKNENGKKFTVFRIANTDKWTDAAGTAHEITTWVDCIMNGEPNVLPFLKKGQQVFVTGSCNLRVYSSAKEKCMKAGLTINVRQVELLGGKSDDVPSRLYSEDGSQEIIVNKFYHAPQLVRNESEAEFFICQSRSGKRFTVDRAGWVNEEKTENQE